jgi:hypothetical protein
MVEYVRYLDGVVPAQSLPLNDRVDEMYREEYGVSFGTRVRDRDEGRFQGGAPCVSDGDPRPPICGSIGHDALEGHVE